MPRTRTPTVVSIILAFGALSIGVRQVQSLPVPLSDEKLKPRSVGCAPYTHWDTSGETCVSCSPEDCLPGEELREDCGYNEEGYPVANSCRPCPNGTYSSNGGQKHCQACKTCLSGYKQECSSKQPSVCLCADDEELAPGGTTCQEICCRCLPDPNPSDVIGECVYRHPTTPQYRCKKYSWSAGETCKQLPQPTTPTVHVSTAAPTGKTNGTTGKTDAPTPSSTPPATPDQPLTAHPSGEASTSGQPIFAVVLEVLAGLAVIIFILCGLKYWKTHNGTEGGDLESSELLQESDDEIGGAQGEEEDADTTDNKEGGGGISIDGEEDSNIKEVDKPSDGDSGTVSNECSETSSDKIESPFSSEDSLLLTSSNTSVNSTDEQGDDTQETGGAGETGETGDSDDETVSKGDDTQETGGPEETGETGDSDDETVPKEPGQEDTMEFEETIEGFPNDEKGRNAVPSGGGGNRPHQQQPQGGRGQPPPYTGPQRQDGQPVFNMSGTFNAPVTIVVQGDNSHYHAGQGMDGQGQGAQNRGRGDGNPADGTAPRQADGRRQQPAQQGIGGHGGGDGAGPNSAAGQGNQGAATVAQNDRLQHPPGNGNGRVGNRRRQDIQVNILPNPARLGQDVRFSCVLPPDIDPSTCEFRWTKRDQVDCVARGQNWNRAVQGCDVGVYTCEVTTPGGEVLDGQAELVIIEDNAAGGVPLPGPSRRPRDNDHTPRKRPRTTGPGTSTSGAQGISASSGQIQGIHQLPLGEILNEEDLLSNLRILLERSDRHYRNIGSHFGLTHEELEFIEFTQLRGKDSPLRAILQKIQTKENVTVGQLLQYCDETLKRRDVVKTVVDYFVEKEQQNQETAMEAKQDVEETSVVADDSQRIDEFRRDSIDNEIEEAGPIDYVPEETLSEPSVALENLGACDTETFELKEMS